MLELASLPGVALARACLCAFWMSPPGRGLLDSHCASLGFVLLCWRVAHLRRLLDLHLRFAPRFGSTFHAGFRVALASAASSRPNRLAPRRFISRVALLGPGCLFMVLDIAPIHLPQPRGVVFFGWAGLVASFCTSRCCSRFAAMVCMFGCTQGAGQLYFGA